MPSNFEVRVYAVVDIVSVFSYTNSRNVRESLELNVFLISHCIAVGDIGYISRTISRRGNRL